MRCAALGFIMLVGCAGSPPSGIGDGRTRSAEHTTIVDLIDATLPPSLHTVPWDSGNIGTFARDIRQAMRFVEDSTVGAVVGHDGSRNSLRASRIYERHGLALVVPTGTSVDLTRAGEWIFQLAPNDSVIGEFIARGLADSLGARQVLLAYQPDTYGLGLSRATAATLDEIGGIAHRARPTPNGSCYTPAERDRFAAFARNAVRWASPDVVVVLAGPSAARCIIEAVAPADPSLRFVTGDAVPAAELRQLTAPMPRAPATYVVELWHEAPGDSVFANRVREALGRDPTPEDAYTWDAFMLAADAIQESGGDRGAIRDWLASLGTSRPAWSGLTGSVEFSRPRHGRMRLRRVAW